MNEKKNGSGKSGVLPFVTLGNFDLLFLWQV